MNANINLITSYRGKITKNDSRHRNTIFKNKNGLYLLIKFSLKGIFKRVIQKDLSFCVSKQTFNYAQIERLESQII
jgi:hypothetical protein